MIGMEDTIRFRKAVEALYSAYEHARSQVESEADADLAYEQARELGDTLGKLYEAATTLRSEMVGRIWESEELSIAGLANRIGVSKARADQLIRAQKARKAGS